MKRIVLFLFLFLQAKLSIASVPYQYQSSGGWQCWADAAARYNVPVDLLYAIALVETGNRANVLSRNKNGTYDIGLMQINSSHLKRLAKIGITQYDLLRDPCLNLHVGAMILAEMIATHGYTWVAIGAYNAKSHEKRAAYARKVFAAYNRIIRERNGQLMYATNTSGKRQGVLEYQRRIKELRKELDAERQRLAMLEAQVNRRVSE